MVRAEAQSDPHAINIECSFISGSTAQGCMVMLLSEVDNTTVNLTRDQNATTLRIAYSVSCYNGVIAFDIEQDRSIGTLPVPGDIASNYDTIECLPTPDGTHLSSESNLIISLNSVLTVIHTHRNTAVVDGVAYHISYANHWYPEYDLCCR